MTAPQLAKTSDALVVIAKPHSSPAASETGLANVDSRVFTVYPVVMLRVIVWLESVVLPADCLTMKTDTVPTGMWEQLIPKPTIVSATTARGKAPAVSPVEKPMAPPHPLRDRREMLEVAVPCA